MARGTQRNLTTARGELVAKDGENSLFIYSPFPIVSFFLVVELHSIDVAQFHVNRRKDLTEIAFLDGRRREIQVLDSFVNCPNISDMMEGVSVGPSVDLNVQLQG